MFYFMYCIDGYMNGNGKGQITQNVPEPLEGAAFDAAGFDFFCAGPSSGPESESELLSRLLARFFSNFGIFDFFGFFVRIEKLSLVSNFHLQPVNSISIQRSFTQSFEKSFSLIEMATRGNYRNKNTAFVN